MAAEPVADGNSFQRRAPTLGRGRGSHFGAHVLPMGSLLASNGNSIAHGGFGGPGLIVLNVRLSLTTPPAPHGPGAFVGPAVPLDSRVVTHRLNSEGAVAWAGTFAAFSSLGASGQLLSGYRQ